MTVEEWLGKDNQIGIDIWYKKYQQDGETFEEWLDRVSGGDQEIRRLIIEKKFLFGGRILSYRGMEKRGMKTSLSNCYVIAPPEDNIESIFECASKLARTYSYGGGCGIDISKLAPRGARVNNAAKTTSGATSFMELYNLVTGLIGQNGRRGAMMISLSCDHPDLEEFIKIKSDLDKINKANISVRITGRFMEAVQDKDMFTLRFTREETGETITKEVDAYGVFRSICEMNWNYAEPGVLFWDNIRRWNLLNEDPEFEYAGTNPCAEEPLPAGGSCLLGSLNLSGFVQDGEFVFPEFRDAVHQAVIALNQVLDEGIPLHPLKEQRESVTNWRQIGLGIFGLADMLIKMKIRYGSQEAIELCDRIGYAMADEAMNSSAKLAREKGAYPKCKYEQTSSQKNIYSPILKSNFFSYNASKDTSDIVFYHGLRNSQLLTIAPTGTLSTMLGVSGGIEPIYGHSYQRKTESLHGHDEYYTIYTPIVKEYMEEHGLKDVTELPDYFVTAKELTYKERIDMQSVWQYHVDASISSTVNVPNDLTVEEVMELYLYAWEKDLKGVTIFREGCERTAILTKIDDGTDAGGELARGMVIKANDNCVGKKRTLHTGCGTLHCEAFFHPKTGELLETYLSKGSTGGCNSFMVGLSRMISLSARGGINIYDIVDQLRSSVTCPSYAVRTATRHDTSKGNSCPDAVGRVLIEMYEELCVELDIMTGESRTDTNVGNAEHVCPECGGEIAFEGGCNTCKNCGWSKCD